MKPKPRRIKAALSLNEFSALEREKSTIVAQMIELSSQTQQLRSQLLRLQINHDKLTRRKWRIEELQTGYYFVSLAATQELMKAESELPGWSALMATLPTETAQALAGLSLKDKAAFLAANKGATNGKD